MNETQFIKNQEQHWKAWERWLDKKELRETDDGIDNDIPQDQQPSSSLPLQIDAAHFSSAYRALAHDVNIAHDRQYSTRLQHKLYQQFLRVYQKVYGAHTKNRGGFKRFLINDLPALVRQEWRVVWLSAALFFIPLMLFIILPQFYPESVYLVLDESFIEHIRSMYATERIEREADDDFLMLGVYIWNNISIDLRCFASGLVFGIGSIFFILYNGFVIGAVAGDLTQFGLGKNFWSFVAGHSAPELIGAVLSGAGGLKLGWAILAPGRYTRRVALIYQGRIAVQLLMGAVLLTFIAAFIEAYWSPLVLNPLLKYGVGISGFVLIILYFTRCRTRQIV